VLRLTMIPAALARALFPRLARATGEEADRLTVDSVGAMAALVTPLTLLAIMAMGPFLQLWVGSGIAPEAARVGYILLPGIWINGLALIAFTALQAREQPQIPAKLHLAETIPYILLLYPAMLYFGVEGTAFVWSLRVVVDALFMFRFAPAGLHSLRQLPVSAMLIVAAATVALLLQSRPWLQLSVLALLFAAGCLVSWRGAPDMAKSGVRHILARLVRGQVQPKADL
jgi:O-antigen/teichoic acid export membrane protein